MSVKNLDALFNPENIALVGASNNPNKAGYVILQNLLNIEYPKKIFPVNTKEKEVLGIKAYEALSQIEEKLEMVVLITPSSLIEAIMKDLEKRMKEKNDVKVIVCAAAGYGETKTEEGIHREKVLLNTAKKYGIRVVGPNCIGVIDNINRVDTTFVETLLPKESRGKKGGVSFISQSGSVAALILMWGASQPVPISFNKFISIGNMTDVDFIDLLEFLEQDEDTKVIGLYLEGYVQARKLVETMSRISKTKPIVVFKVGRSEIGATAANSHTGSLAGSDRIYDAAFKQYGIVRVDNIEELMDTLQAFDKLPLPETENLFLMSQAGGPGIFSTDEISKHEFVNMPIVSEKTKEKLKDLLPDMASICAPEGYADITASANSYQHGKSLEIVLDDPNVSSVIFITVIIPFISQKEVAQFIIKAFKEKGYDKKKPIYTVIMAGNYVVECRKLLEEEGIFTFETPDRAVKAAANMIKYTLYKKNSRKEVK